MKDDRPTTNPRPTLLDVAAVAQRLGVDERHVRRLVQARRIPFIKWGHYLRFDPEEVESWLDRCRTAPEPRHPSAA